MQTKSESINKIIGVIKGENTDDRASMARQLAKLEADLLERLSGCVKNPLDTL